MMAPVQPPVPYRDRVLAVLQAAARPMTGREIAERAGLSYKQTIDALNALYNHSRVARNGRKFMARWVPLPPAELPPDSPFVMLELAFRALMRK